METGAYFDQAVALYFLLRWELAVLPGTRRRLEGTEEKLETLSLLMDAIKSGNDAQLKRFRHDLRGPLCSVIGYTSLLLEEEGMSLEQKRFAENIAAASNKLLLLINQDDEPQSGATGALPLRQEESG